METKVLSKSIFTEKMPFEDNYDYCLVTPIGENLEMTHFNVVDRDVVMLRESAGQLKVNKESSVLFCLTPQSELMPPNLGCYVAVKRNVNEQ